MVAREAVKSRIPKSDGSIDLTWIVEGTIDDAQAENEAFSASFSTYRGRFRSNAPDVSQIGRGIWEFTFNYFIPGVGEENDDPQGDIPTIGTLEIDGSGGTAHVTQAIDTAYYGATPENTQIAEAIYRSRIVGFHKDGVNGVDIDVPGTTYTLTKKFLPQIVSGQYLYNLSRMRGKINYYYWTLYWAVGGAINYIYFAPAELRFINYRASITQTTQGLSCWEISYTLLHSANIFNLEVVPPGQSTDFPPIVVPFKGGHHYLWHLYKKKEFAGGFIEMPELTFQSRMYEWEDFGAVLGF